MASRRGKAIFLAFCGIFGIVMFRLLQTMREAQHDPVLYRDVEALPLQAKENVALQLGQTSLSGHVIAPKLGNETAKAELGRATWKYFHTVMARFPEKPTEEESNALRIYIHLFQRLYPCGECSEHFGELLKKFPPQVSSRNSAAAWACHVHNEVNKSLKKDIFDCANIGDFYDCGCADDEEEDSKSGKKKEPPEKAKTTEVRTPRPAKAEMSDEMKEKLIMNGRDFNTDLLRTAEDG